MILVYYIYHGAVTFHNCALISMTKPSIFLAFAFLARVKLFNVIIPKSFNVSGARSVFLVICIMIYGMPFIYTTFDIVPHVW